jgi:hypothetical protein
MSATNSLKDLLNSQNPATWGNVVGTLSNQTDLDTTLTGLAPLSGPTFTGVASFDQISTDGGNITTDGAGDITCAGLTVTSAFSTYDGLDCVGNASSALDDGLISTDGYGSLTAEFLTATSGFASDDGAISSDGLGNMSVNSLLVYGGNLSTVNSALPVIDLNNCFLYSADYSTVVLDFATQAGAIANATTAVDVIPQFNALLAALRAYGLLAT